MATASYLPEPEREFPVVISYTRTYLAWIPGASPEVALLSAQLDTLDYVTDLLPFEGEIEVERAEQIDIEADRNKIPFGPWRPGEPHSYDWEHSTDTRFLWQTQFEMGRAAKEWIR